MSKRYRYDTGNIIDQKTGEILTDIKTRNRLNKQDETITQLLIDNNELLELNNNYHTKMIKAEKQVQTIKQQIKEMMNNERTHIGHNTLKQLWEAIQ